MFLLIRALALALVLFAATGAAAQNGPVANAGPDQTIDCALPTGAEVELDGSESTPAQGLTYSWANDQQVEVATGATPTLTLLPGVHVLTLTVEDGAAATASDDVTITVNADEAPEIVLKDGSTELWPPNHEAHPYAAADLVEEVIDDCSELLPEDVFFTRATSDEPDDGKGDGNTRGDVSFGEGCSEAFVRAERAGPGNGRVYQLFLQVGDEIGNLSEEVAFRVKVPHDQARDAKKGKVEAEYTCTAASCATEPSDCALATSGEVALRNGKKGPSLRWRAQGFDSGVSDEGNRLCLYVDNALEGGSAAPDKVKVKDKAGSGSLKLSTKGADLEIPALPLAADAALLLELHDAYGSCVSASFDAPHVNEPGRYQAETN